MSDGIDAMRAAAQSARDGSLKLNELSHEQRQQVLRAVADALHTRRVEVLAANALDMALAKETDLAVPLLRRLELTDKKIDVLVEGIRGIAAQPNPLGRILSSRHLDSELLLVQQTASIGVLLIIFESRPDSLPQIAALTLSSGNGLLLKGGKEAEHSNAALHAVIVDAVVAAAPSVPRGTIALIADRAAVHELLKLDGDIDLVIPRGGNAMVQSIQRSTNIPVLGHADGICHVYVHDDTSVADAIAVATDAKLNYPAACNAAETLLLHESLLTAPYAAKSDEAITTSTSTATATSKAAFIVESMRASGVAFLVGPRLRQWCASNDNSSGSSIASRAVLPSPVPLDAPEAESLRVEYGDHHMTVECVASLEEAVAHINANGSHHTDAIVTASRVAAVRFEKAVDSACVFHNCSTRFADGYRFGLGAEVGISTSRIHARGPVGVEGLLTMKWVLGPIGGAEQQQQHSFATVEQFQSGQRTFTHTPVDQQ